MRGSIKPRWSPRQGRNVWDVRVDAPPRGDGRRRQVTVRGFATRRAAEAKLAELLAQIERGTYQEPSKVVLAQFLEEWLRGASSRIRATTRDSYSRIIQGHLIPSLGGVKLTQLTPDQINSAYAEMLAHGRRDGRGGLAPRTVAYAHAILRKALGDANRWGLIQTNPAAAADPPRPQHQEMQTWSAPELAAFLQSVRDDRLSAAWVLAAATGLRRGELLALRWSDLDLDAATLSVRRSVSPTRAGLVVSEPKTSHARRTVALDRRTVSALREHRRRQAEERLRWGAAYEDGGLVFARENGSPIAPEWITKAFVKHARRAGLRQIRFHDLRHTHATLALQAGVHPKIVSERLGHAGIAITLDTYSHSIPALEESAAERIADVMYGHSAEETAGGPRLAP